jgi:tRNA(adenine34) deaminase
LEAIHEACRNAGGWRLTDSTLYVTLEPCPMCAGAVINARLSTVIYGAKEPRSGSVGSVINLFEENYGHRPAVYGGVLSEDCARLLAEFFRGIR